MKFKVLKAFEYGDDKFAKGDIITLNIDDSEDAKKTAEEWKEKGLIAEVEEPKAAKVVKTDDGDKKDEPEDKDADIKKMVTDAVVAAMQAQHAASKGVPQVTVTKENWLDDPTWGWGNQGQHARAVAMSAMNKFHDPRLIRQAEAGRQGDLYFNPPKDLEKVLGRNKIIWKHTDPPATRTITSDAEAAGNLLAPGFLYEVLRHIYRETSIAAQVRNIAMTTNSMDIPSDETYPWGVDATPGTGNQGISANWTDEGAQIDQSKVKILRQTLKPHKLAVLVPVTDEMLADEAATSLDSYIGARAGEDLSWETDLAMLTSPWTNTDRPNGILDATGNLALENVQGPISTGDEVLDILAKMYSQQCYPERAVWVINHDFWPTLISAQLGTQPVWIPGNSIAGAPYGMIWGRPVLLHQAMLATPTSGLGIGGCSFLDLSGGYISGTRGGIQSAVSIHIYFETQHTAFRYTMRIDGKTVFKNKVVPAQSGSTNKSSYVVYQTNAA